MSIKEEIFKELKKLTNIKFTEESLIKDLGIDSLDLVEMVTDLEEKLDVIISDEELTSFKKISDVIDSITKNKK